MMVHGSTSERSQNQPGRLRTAYLIAFVVFCLSVPAALNMDKIVFFARGYPTNVVSMREGRLSGEELEQVDTAFFNERGRIALWTRLMAALWIVMFVFSVVLIRTGAPVPFKLHYIGAVASGVLVAVTLVPILIFGRGWPPRAT